MLAGQGQSVCTKVTFFLFNLGAKKLIFTSKSRKILRNGPFGGKGQLNSERIYEVIVCPKIPIKNYRDFCPGIYYRVGQKSL